MSNWDNSPQPERSKAEYNYPPPNSKYAQSPEYVEKEFEQARRQYYPPAGYYPQEPVSPMYPYAVTSNEEINLLVRALWFLCVGMWLGWIWMFAGYFLCMTIIGLPLGLFMLNRLPFILTLRTSKQPTAYAQYPDGSGYFITHNYQQSFLIRAIYFLFIGWWASLVWCVLAQLLCMTIIGLPLGLMMFNRLPEVMTLRRY